MLNATLIQNGFSYKTNFKKRIGEYHGPTDGPGQANKRDGLGQKISKMRTSSLNIV